ncbi:enoyl-CoA hydratase-related protein [Sphingomonas sp.]|uniref:enoyl-CoA hydratase/isomerase family protein n=1 Tax=Sphingomonas sp. TaxID=28214 RepID=UPI001ECD882B|nr:enoyl-CoA hydratase-related protein [Sphingomonas sp.]MBX3595790.1 enoyl-CoA hydratase/isomerase family protein [Sphingomonas sp.]
MSVRFERDGAVAVITLDRPDKGNAIDLAVAQALLDAAIACEADSAIRCVLLTGAGRMFCAGGDIAGFAGAGDGAQVYLAELAGTLHAALLRFAAMPKPMVVAVNGPAAGAGMSLAMAGDIVIAAASAHFTAAYTAIGLTPDGGTTWLLPRLVGLRRAQELVLTNRRVGAEEAKAIGLVTEVVADDALAEAARGRADGLARGATRALGGARVLLQQSFSSELATQLERETRSIASAGGGSEAREGIAAFMAKRPPDYQGS